MKFKLIVIGFILLQKTFAAAPSLKVYDESALFPFLSRGKIVSYIPAYASNTESNGVLAIYRKRDGSDIPLTGNPVGLERMMAIEMPNGVDRSFVESQLVRLFAAYIGGDRTLPSIGQRFLDMIKGKKPQRISDREYSPYFKLPIVRCNEKEWAIRIVNLSSEGTMTIRVFKGSLRPFRIDTSAEFILCSTFSDFDASHAASMQSKADRLYECAGPN